ncbi:MAG: hypothetical protein HQ518_28910 [Rhodopirellula sp.]|nr:hypothetical protein [Rhodopirellula sp.]
MTLLASIFLLSTSLLAAEFELLRSPAARGVAWVVGLVSVVGAAWLASIVAGSIKRRTRAKQISTSKQSANVFDEICDAQGLIREEKRQLLDAATLLELPAPALLFIDSGLLNKLATSGRDDAGEFKKLADRLFPPAALLSESDLRELTKSVATV